MSLDIFLSYEISNNPNRGWAWSGNITHNLGKMAAAVGLYRYVWRPEEVDITRAGQMIRPLQLGLCYIRWNRVELMAYTPDNNWGSVCTLEEFVRDYLRACQSCPDAFVEVSR